MGFLKRIKERRQQRAAEQLSKQATDLYAKHNGDIDKASKELQEDLQDKVGLDIATIISLVQIAFYIWNWLKESGIDPFKAKTVALPEYDFPADQLTALGAYGDRLDTAA